MTPPTAPVPPQGSPENSPEAPSEVPSPSEPSKNSKTPAESQDPISSLEDSIRDEYIGFLPVRDEKQFPWRFVLYSLGALILGHVVSIELWKILHGVGVPIYGLLLACLGLFYVVAYWLNRYRTDYNIIKIRFTFLLIGMLTSSVGIAVSVHERITTAFHAHPETTEIIEHASISTMQIITLIVGFPAAWFCVYYAHHFGEKLKAIRTLSEQEIDRSPQSTVRHLILPVSEPNVVPKLQDEKIIFTNNADKSVTVDLNNPQSLDVLIPEFNKLGFCNWQQMLRSVEAHQNTKKLEIWLIGSNGKADQLAHRQSLNNMIESDTRGKHGSFGFLEIASLLLRAVLGQDQDVMIHRCCSKDEKLAFESVEKTTQMIQGVIALIKKDKSINEKQIFIDVTGGKKAVSVSGAIVTLSQETRFQYVDTAPPTDTENSKDNSAFSKFKVFAYDVRIVDPPKSPG